MCELYIDIAYIILEYVCLMLKVCHIIQSCLTPPAIVLLYYWSFYSLPHMSVKSEEIEYQEDIIEQEVASCLLENNLILTRQKFCEKLQFSRLCH